MVAEGVTRPPEIAPLLPEILAAVALGLPRGGLALLRGPLGLPRRVLGPAWGKKHRPGPHMDPQGPPGGSHGQLRDPRDPWAPLQDFPKASQAQRDTQDTYGYIYIYIYIICMYIFLFLGKGIRMYVYLYMSIRIQSAPLTGPVSRVIVDWLSQSHHQACP